MFPNVDVLSAVFVYLSSRCALGDLLPLILKKCEWEGDVVAVVAPHSGVAQVVSHGVKVVGVHEEERKEKDEEVRVEVKGEVEENQRQPLIMDGMWMKVKDSRTT